MRGVRKDMGEELDLLKGRLRRLIYQHHNESRPTVKLLREAERSIEDQFARLNSLRSAREEIGRRFRKRIPSTIRPELRPNAMRSDIVRGNVRG
jgi:hypothetical protein